MSNAEPCMKDTALAPSSEDTERSKGHLPIQQFNKHDCQCSMKDIRSILRMHQHPKTEQTQLNIAQAIQSFTPLRVRVFEAV